jgi:hypothetical protein
VSTNKELQVVEIPNGLAVTCQGLDSNDLSAAAAFVDSLVPDGTETKENGGDTLVPSHDDIAKLAFAFYEMRGRKDGFDAEDWRLAEEELLRRRV